MLLNGYIFSLLVLALTVLALTDFKFWRQIHFAQRVRTFRRTAPDIRKNFLDMKSRVAF